MVSQSDTLLWRLGIRPKGVTNRIADSLWKGSEVYVHLAETPGVTLFGAQTAGRTISDLMRKLGERVVPDLMPIIDAGV